MNQKQVKIIGLSIKENFGALKATELTFDENNRLTVIKGEVGSGKTTLNKAMRLTTQGSSVLKDKSLYGENLHLEAQISDGDRKIFIGCKSSESNDLSYFLYMLDEKGKKINDVVVDGVKLTPANYLKSMQTALTWRLDELTSENPTVQRNILLELYASELEERGVVFDKNNPNYVGGIIDQIEKAKNQRNYADMKRKECGGIADDLQKKGVDYSERRIVKNPDLIRNEISEIKSKIQYSQTNLKEKRDADLNLIKSKGLENSSKLKEENFKIKERNLLLHNKIEESKKEIEKLNQYKIEFLEALNKVATETSAKDILSRIEYKSIPTILQEFEKELEYNEKGNCISIANDFNEPIKSLLSDYSKISSDYITLYQKPLEEVDNSENEALLLQKENELKSVLIWNEEAKAVNSYIDWKDENTNVMALNKDYFNKLTGINTGVDGLHICPEYTLDESGNKIAKGNDIYLMYNGSYDPEYFHNPEKTLRKLSSYSDTQKPMICLLIQKYLLSKKAKVLPYLWIDQVPIDKKTKALLDKMSDELGLWLFVNWTGDFDKANLVPGEILIENGQVFEALNND